MVFYAPCIPQNSGNAIRLVANAGSHLHLIKPLGFDLDEAKLRRAGLDYHDLAVVTVHENMDDFFSSVQPGRAFAFTAKAKRWHSDIAYRRTDALIFGAEPTGLPDEVKSDDRVNELVRIPMMPYNRSMNLANAASIVLYEAWRQFDFEGAT